MSLELYNSLTRQKEPFKPVVPGHVGIYFCGPTVYSEPHLGHARGPIVFDVLRRWLQHEGYSVRLVENVTDVGHLTDDADEGEDKLAKRAKLERLEPMEIAEKYFWSYFDALAKLNIRRPDIVPRASGHIIEQIEMTQELIKRGLAYERDGSVYFDVSQWKDYGELSGRDVDEQVEGTRVAVRSDKDDPRDFALWKRAEPEHIMRWNSPWGEGFPGWHIECSVMSTKYLGDEFDIHGGGLDLIFPHHECEIAQAKAAGKKFARVWLHWNMITLGGEKMAKSKNHFVTLKELFDEHDPAAIRFHMLRSHYRSFSDFSEESLLSSTQGLKRLREAYLELKRLSNFSNETSAGSFDQGATTRSTSGSSSGHMSSSSSGFMPSASRSISTSFNEDPFIKGRTAFAEAMNDDLNTPQAIAVLFDATRDLNSKLATKPPKSYINAAKKFYEDLLGEILGITLDAGDIGQTDTTMLDGLLQLIINQRQEARQRRDFKTSDEIRNRLTELGITLEDTAEGSRWKLS
jgi:cysteinyl-tRNA synthetase